MERDANPSPRPLLLVGKQGEAMSALVRASALRTCFVVLTPPEASVDALVAALKPTAVLLEATELYLEGPQRASRLQERSRGSRILFLDVDQLWALWMEIESEETRDFLISPCEIGRAGETLMEMLNGAAGRRRSAPHEAVRLESTG